MVFESNFQAGDTWCWCPHQINVQHVARVVKHVQHPTISSSLLPTAIEIWMLMLDVLNSAMLL